MSAATNEPPPACPHPEAVGTRYGDPLSAERQTELQSYLDSWNAPDADHRERRGPFDGVELTGADVSWLAEQSGRDDVEGVPNLHLEGAYLTGAHLESAFLSDVHLENASLSEAHLEGTLLSEAHLEGAYLHDAHLEGAYLSDAHLQGAILTAAHLKNADLHDAHLQGAYLSDAHLEGAILTAAHLEGADARRAHLEGADLSTAHLERKTYEANDPDYLRIQRWAKDYRLTLPPADLRGAVLDAATALSDITLGDAGHGVVRVADVRWGGANLAVVDWMPLIEPRTELGDELAARTWKLEGTWELAPPIIGGSGRLSRQQMRMARAKLEQMQAKLKLETFRAAVRANRQLATVLRDQGMNEEADRFAYRAQVIQRRVFRQQGKRGRAVFSLFLDGVAGHGYRPERSLYTYVGVILLFALLYLLAGNALLTFGLPASQFHGLPWYEALILSISSFHGRGFFQPVNSLGDPVAILAAAEAICGLFIEVSFIATFTQRFFGK